MDQPNIRISGIFSGLIAILALAVSLASAGWSVFAYIKSSEVSALPFEGVTFINDAGVAQIALEVSVANLAYGEYDDVARDQFLTLHTGERQIRFVARQIASVRPLSVNAEGVAETLEYPCRLAGNVIAACVTSETPVVSLPAGGVVTIHPIFELAPNNCGLDDCRVLDAQALAALLTPATTATYTVVTMRDGERAWSCPLAVDAEGAAFLAAAGWYNPPCRETAS